MKNSRITATRLILLNATVYLTAVFLPSLLIDLFFGWGDLVLFGGASDDRQSGQDGEYSRG